MDQDASQDNLNDLQYDNQPPVDNNSSKVISLCFGEVTLK